MRGVIPADMECAEDQDQMLAAKPVQGRDQGVELRQQILFLGGRRTAHRKSHLSSPLAEAVIDGREPTGDVDHALPTAVVDARPGNRRAPDELDGDMALDELTRIPVEGNRR